MRRMGEQSLQAIARVSVAKPINGVAMGFAIRGRSLTLAIVYDDRSPTLRGMNATPGSVSRGGRSVAV